MTITFGRVPLPPVVVRDIENSTAWDDLGPRVIRGVVWHRILGSLRGTDVYFRNEAKDKALTDYGIGVLDTDGAALDGVVYRWNDPRGRRAPWASGPVSLPYGDGKAFVDRYGVNAVNRDTVSIEISGDQLTPLSDKSRASIVALTAYWADQYKVSWETFPNIPGEDGRSFVIWHKEFTIGTGKLCPFAVVTNETPALITATKAYMRTYQASGATVPPADVEPFPIPWERGDLGGYNINGHPAFALLVEVMAVKDNVPLRVGADSNAKVGRRMKQGEKAVAIGSLFTGRSKWIIVDTGDGRPWRALAGHFTPRVPTP